MIAFSSSMEIPFLLVVSKFVLKYIFVKIHDLEKETKFRFLLGLTTNIYFFLLKYSLFWQVLSILVFFFSLSLSHIPVDIYTYTDLLLDSRVIDGNKNFSVTL